MRHRYLYVWIKVPGRIHAKQEGEPGTFTLYLVDFLV